VKIARQQSGFVAPAALALLLTHCGRVTEIDVLVPRDAAANAVVETGPVTVDACGPSCEDASPPKCIDPSNYPGGGIFKTDFSDVSDMTINQGASAMPDGTIRLVSVSGIEEGSAYFTMPVPFDAQTSVYARFAMRIGGGAGPMGTDGMAFVLQNSPAGPAAIGIAGGGLGYKLVAPSVAIEFDTFFNPATDPNGNHVALIAHGDELTHIAWATPSFDLNDGVVRNVWVDYEAGSKLLEVYMSDSATRPSAPLLTYTGFDFAAELGNQFYFGFSAASGSMKNDHDLLGEAWFVTSPLPMCRD
jgi:hypothetical protein